MSNPWTPLKNDPKSVRNQAILKKFRDTSPNGLDIRTTKQTQKANSSIQPLNLRHR